MIKHIQRFRHKPEEGIFGDCHRTCFACLMDLEPEEVPNFGEHYADPVAFKREVDKFLALKGYLCLEFPSDCELDFLFTLMDNINPKAYYILGGLSRTGVNHSVIGLGNQIYHDPSQTQAGIIGPCTDGFYWITFLVPKHFTTEA